MANRTGPRATATAADRHWLLLVLVISFLFLALVFVWMQTQQIHAGYRLAQAQASYHQELDLQRKLELSWAQLTAPARLEQVARAQFHLAPPTPEQTQVLSEPHQ